MAVDHRIAAAVFNNAAWCDAVCRAFGCDTEFVDGLWLNHSPSPPSYPNAATLTREGPDAQSRRIRLMTEGWLTSGWGVKDSFSTLDLAAHGFELALTGEWLALPTGRGLPDGDLDGVRWEPVTNEQELAAWEAAWRGAPRNAPANPLVPARIFMRALLRNPDVVLLAAYRRGQIVGVVAGSLSDDGSGPVAGVSNMVLPSRTGEGHRAGALAAVRSAFPNVPLASYERGASLDAMKRLGFDPLGPLRVWVRA